MSEDVYIFTLVVFLTVLIVVPAIFFDYRIKSRRLSASAENGAATQDLWAAARRMETRIGYLETVLDTEVPGWRSRSEAR